MTSVADKYEELLPTKVREELCKSIKQSYQLHNIREHKLKNFQRIAITVNEVDYILKIVYCVLRDTPLSIPIAKLNDIHSECQGVLRGNLGTNLLSSNEVKAINFMLETCHEIIRMCAVVKMRKEDADGGVKD